LFLAATDCARLFPRDAPPPCRRRLLASRHPHLRPPAPRLRPISSIRLNVSVLSVTVSRISMPKERGLSREQWRQRKSLKAPRSQSRPLDPAPLARRGRIELDAAGRIRRPPSTFSVCNRHKRGGKLIQLDCAVRMPRADHLQRSPCGTRGRSKGRPPPRIAAREDRTAPCPVSECEREHTQERERERERERGG
jgi:hypothetical protein